MGSIFFYFCIKFGSIYQVCASLVVSSIVSNVKLGKEQNKILLGFFSVKNHHAGIVPYYSLIMYVCGQNIENA